MKTRGALLLAFALAAGLHGAPAPAEPAATAAPAVIRAGTDAPASGAHDRRVDPVELSAEELQALAAGEDVVRHQKQGEYASALVVFDVAATPAQVWKVLNAFERYPGWIDNVQSTEVYRGDATGVYVHFQARTPFGRPWIWFARHLYPAAGETPPDAFGTWELDPEYRSTFLAAHGYWRVAALPGAAATTRVTYASNIRLRGVTALFRGMVLRRMIREGPAWVRRALAAPAQSADRS